MPRGLRSSRKRGLAWGLPWVAWLRIPTGHRLLARKLHLFTSAEEPVLIDTGVGVEGPDFLAALESIIAPEELRWIWLTHDDADHTGSSVRCWSSRRGRDWRRMPSPPCGWPLRGRSLWTAYTR
jgi:glyoxylase-like metal-dependent hydrolase (beta-lactamase superfamily II)